MTGNRLLSFLKGKYRIEVVSICVFIIIWELIADFVVKELYKLPGPISVFYGFYKVKEFILLDIAVSLLHFGIGLAAGVIVGITLGGLMGWFKTIDRAIDPLVEIVRAIPPIAWIPFAIMWLKLTHYSAGFIVFLGAVFPILVNTYAGFREVDKVYIDAAKVLGCDKGIDLIKYVVIPHSIPYTAAGTRIAIGIGWMCVVAAEMLGASRAGLGYRLWSRFYLLHMMDKLVAYMIIIGLIALVMDRVFRYFVEGKILKWKKGMVAV
ncbi:MAG TPA: ABC transporter permease [Candidatus Syntrophoarchaeum butanivorans]|uniref:ABC transporter permease n=1 Tax=Candidatus Syntropharchaeum butanivorans TaxID=1839936 RepID=A0A7J2S0T8_9EURY|nr:ABC transporter permease [Candidatus Syntrophoarchaeum butanivorans]